MKEAHCLNCAALLTGPWCAACGQRGMPADPTWGEVTHQAAAELLNVDGKVLVTVRLLLTRPGELTAELLRGRRAPYVNPLRLYLTASLVYFLLGAVLPNPDVNVDPAVSQPGPEASIAAALDRILAAVPRAIFALVPVFAWIVRLTHRDVRRNYPAFLYFSLHVHTAFFLVLTLTVPLQMFASDIWINAAQLTVFLGMVAYLASALQRTFGDTRSQAFRRAALIVGLHLPVFAGTLVVLWFMLT